MKTIAVVVLSPTLMFASLMALAQSEPKPSQLAVYENKELGVSFKIPEGWIVGDNAAKQAYAQAAQMQASQKLLLLLTRKMGDAPTERITVVADLFEKGVHPTLDSAEHFMDTWAEAHPKFERLAAGNQKPNTPTTSQSTAARTMTPDATARFKSKSEPERWTELYAMQARGTFFRVMGEFNSEAALRAAKMRLRIVPDWVNPNEQVSDQEADKPDKADKAETAEKAPSNVSIPQSATQGLLIKKVRPEYPEQARKRRIQGQVVLQGSITKRGKIAELTIIFGEPSLVASAIQAVKQWEYRPYLLNGEAVEVETLITVNFTLQ